MIVLHVPAGRLEVGARCLASRGATFAVAELWIMHGDRHTAVEAAGPGEIVVVPGDFGLRTGDTLSAPEQPESLPIPEFPAPVLTGGQRLRCR